MYAVDPWDLTGNVSGRFGFARATTREAFLEQTRPYPNIVPIQGFGVEVARHWDGPPIGLLFVDGDHSEQAVYNDVREWHKHLTLDATIILDDLDTPKNPGVRRPPNVCGEPSDPSPWKQSGWPYGGCDPHLPRPVLPDAQSR